MPAPLCAGIERTSAEPSTDGGNVNGPDDATQADLTRFTYYAQRACDLRLSTAHDLCAARDLIAAHLSRTSDEGSTMPDQSYSTAHEREAFELGAAAGIAAASWVADGNTPTDHIVRMIGWANDGDMRFQDYLPAMPDLSGEWADSPTPASLYEEIIGVNLHDAMEDAGLASETLVGTAVDAIADAWEAGVAFTFEHECERILRAMAPEPTVCAGTGDHTGQGIVFCDECNPAKYEEEN